MTTSLMISFSEITNQLIIISVEYLPKFVGAILVYIIGMWIIKRFCKGFHVIMNKRQYEPTLQSFFIHDILLKKQSGRFLFVVLLLPKDLLRH